MIAYDRVTRAEDLGAIANAILSAQVLGLDIETTDLDPYEGEIRLVQLNVGGKIYVIDLFQTGTLEPVVSALRESKAIKIIHNVKFEQKWLKFKYDLELWPVFCTFRASALIYNGMEFGKRSDGSDVGNNLWDVEQRELGIEHAGENDQGKSDWSSPVLTEDQWNYAAKDVEYLLRLREILKKRLSDDGLIQVALIEFESILAECVIEINGFFLDKERWLRVSEENVKEVRKRGDLLLSLLPHPKGQLGLPGMLPSWNLNSTDQMLASLHQLAGPIKQNGRVVDYKNKTLGALDNTREMTLAVAAAEVPDLRRIIDYREVRKQLDSFGPAYLQHVSKHTGRVHTSFYAMLDTGRYSSSNPNLQQIPRDPRFRRCFSAEEGWELVAADYAGIEMRIVAEISGDEELINIFLTDQDPHKVTASVVMAKALEAVTKLERQLAKPVNFGLIYGMMPAKLVLYAASGYGVYMSEKEASVYHKRYFSKFDGVARWHQRVMRDGKREKCSRTLSGRVRYLDPDIAWNEFKNCLDAKTEALTRRGWIPGMELREDDVLLTKNADTNALEWQQVTDVRKWPEYDGPLVEFRSRSFSAVSTPDHRWLVTSKATGRPICKKTSEISVYGDHRIHRTGDYEGASTSSYSNDFVELCGWFLTDGSFEIRERKRSEDRQVAHVFQSERANPDAVARIDALLDRLGETPWRSVDEQTECVFWGLGERVSGLLNGLFKDRILTTEFLEQLTYDQLDLLLEVMLIGDGSVEETGKLSFCTKSARGAGMFQVLCTLNGLASHAYARDMSKYKPKSSKLRNVPKMGIVHMVNVLRRDKVQVLAGHKREYNSKEPIWCPIVPNTYFVARREGQVFVTGNTPVQGTGADGLKASLPIVYREMKKYGSDMKMIHIVHDEIILECRKDPEVNKEARRILHDGMKTGMEKFLKKVPVVVEPASGDDWSSVKG